jgi:hypothetical protein
MNFSTDSVYEKTEPLTYELLNQQIEELLKVHLYEVQIDTTPKLDS